MSALLELALQFGLLSLMAFGGVITVLPLMQQVVVSEQHWMSAQTFLELYAIAQAAPGPNILVVTLIGWQVAGLGGALVATIAVCLPSSLLMFALEQVWTRVGEHWLARAVRAGIAPLAVGLVLAGATLVARSMDTDWRLLALSAAAVAFALLVPRNPLWMIAGGALLGLAGLV